MPAMRCHTCRYALWSLTEPRCPECGTGFDLRDFAFEPGSVAFACPHCHHLHAGQGRYHQPSSDDQALCRQCARPMTVVDMPVMPLKDDARGVPIRLTPWERHYAVVGWWRQRCRQRGLLRACLDWLDVKQDRAWWVTCWRGMFRPLELAQSIGPHSQAGKVNGFALIAWGGAAACHALLAGAFLGTVMAVLAAAGRLDNAAQNWVTSVALNALVTSCCMMGWFICVVVGEFATHLGVIATGKHCGGLRQTMLAVAYGQSPAIIATIPIFGLPVAYFWCKASAIVQLSVVQGVSISRSAVACLWLPVLVVLLTVAALLAVAVGTLSW